MTISSKDKENKPKPEKKACWFCGKEVELVSSWDGWEAPDVHQECEQMTQEYKRIGIDPLFWKLPVFKVEQGNKTAFEAVERFIKNPTNKGLFLFGKAGTGKTHLAVKIAQEVKSLRVRFIKVPRLLLELKSNFDGKGWENEQIIDRLANVDLLILDDLGAEKASEWVAETIFVLIDERYGNMRPTIITSNLSPDELVERLGDRIFSRIAGTCEVIEIKSSDKRKS